MENIDECECIKPDPWVDDLGRTVCWECLKAPLLERHQYHPLQTKTEIRLITLSSGIKHDELFCHIKPADLNDEPEYEAVSYTWGDLSLCERILCRNSGVLAITRNCAAVLRDLRYKDQERTLWIDAICIDQDNKKERGHQVKLMQRVYSQAQQVLIHLATSVPDDVGFAIKAISQDVLPNLDEEERSKVQTGLTSLVSLPWFSRVWVLQEVASAQGASIVIGNIKTKWSFLSEGRLIRAGLTLKSTSESVPAVLRLADGNSKPFEDPLSLITTARSCLASDPRDKIFALLGLFRQQSNLRIEPDYNQSVEDLYTRVTRKIIRMVNSLDILSEVGKEAKWAGEANKIEMTLQNHVEEVKQRAQQRETQREQAEKIYAPNLGSQLSSVLETMYPQGQIKTIKHSLQFFSRKLLSITRIEGPLLSGSEPVLIQIAGSFYQVNTNHWLRSHVHDLITLGRHRWSPMKLEPDGLESRYMLGGYPGGISKKSKWDKEFWASPRATREFKGWLSEFCQEARKHGHHLHAWMQGDFDPTYSEISHGDYEGYEIKIEDGCRPKQTWDSLVQAKSSKLKLKLKPRRPFLVKKKKLTKIPSERLAWNMQRVVYSDENELMETIVTACSLLTEINAAVEESDRLPELRKSAEAEKMNAEKAEGIIQNPPQRFGHLPDGFLVSYEWLDRQLLSTTDFPHVDLTRLPSWVPDLRTSVCYSSLDIWRSVVNSKETFAIEGDQKCHSMPISALRVKVLVLEHIDSQPIAQGRSYAFPNLSGKCNHETIPVIRLDSPAHFWSDMEESLQDASHSVNSIRGFSYGRKLGRTTKSFIICPLGTRPTDIVCLIFGSCVPFVLRRNNLSLENDYELIGECYLHGLRGPKVMNAKQNYVDLLGAYAEDFEANSKELPWKEACLV